MLRRPRRSWLVGDAAKLAVLLGVGLWLHRQPLMDITLIGMRDAEQSHILLAPLVVMWLLWLRRSRLRFVAVQPSLLGPCVAALGWLVSWWGFETGVQAAWHGGALVSLAGIVLSMTGVTPVRLFGPALGALVFLLPVPGELRHRLALPLQELATSGTHSMLQVMGVAAERSGNVLIINGQQVAVGEACNGMRIAFALGLVVFAFAFSLPLKPGTRLALLALSPAIALTCNIVRLVPTSLLFGYGDVELAAQFHDYAGWAMLPLAMLMLWALLRAIRWLDFPVTHLRLASQ